MAESVVMAIGPCWLCERTFTYHPETVPSLLIDPVTGTIPPDRGGDPRCARREPLCLGCVLLVNRLRGEMGMRLLDIPPGAYL